MDYPEAAPGYQPKVQHMSEFLAERIETGELEMRGEASGTMTFQDPCRLGRHLGVTDAPRRVLESFGNGENGSRFQSLRALARFFRGDRSVDRQSRDQGDGENRAGV